MDGHTLEETWSSLSEAQKIAIADQLVQIRKQLRFHHVAFYSSC